VNDDLIADVVSLLVGPDAEEDIIAVNEWLLSLRFGRGSEEEQRNHRCRP
jgi:hypothetical protein